MLRMCFLNALVTSYRFAASWIFLLRVGCKKRIADKLIFGWEQFLLQNHISFAIDALATENPD